MPSTTGRWRATSRANALLATLACLAKLAQPPACVHLLSAHGGHGCGAAHLSHGRGSAGEFAPEPAPAFVMGAAAEVAMGQADAA